MNQSEFLSITKGAGKNRAHTLRLVLVLVVFSLVDIQARNVLANH